MPTNRKGPSWARPLRPNGNSLRSEVADFFRPHSSWNVPASRQDRIVLLPFFQWVSLLFHLIFTCFFLPQYSAATLIGRRNVQSEPLDEAFHSDREQRRTTTIRSRPVNDVHLNDVDSTTRFQDPPSRLFNGLRPHFCGLQRFFLLFLVRPGTAVVKQVKKRKRKEKRIVDPRCAPCIRLTLGGSPLKKKVETKKHTHAERKGRKIAKKEQHNCKKRTEGAGGLAGGCSN